MKYNTLAFSLSLILGSQLANANPVGGQVVQGSATFTSPSSNILNVTNSNNTVINWQSFNIGTGQTTNFIQPSSASSVLNRVVTNSPSQLLGNLNSNGRVFLINQHGILVGEGAQVNTAGFFASTLNITDNDYLNGRLKFEGDSSAGINNQGYIHAGDNGNIVLIAPNIENGGVIEVENGNVILAAGQSITISSLENPSIQFEVTGNENTVTNLGEILVDQGSASLFAGTLQHSGVIRAGGLVQNADGSISLVAKGSNQVSGVVDASGNEGGYIEVLGDTVTLENGAEINASGASAGGEILIGGDQQGLNPDIQNARSTTVSAGATVNADATDNGNGGKVIIFAEDDVHVHGLVTAKGGSTGGNGGFIETSGLKSLEITSVPDASAVNGVSGEWLIDPDNITISSGTDNLIVGTSDFTTLGNGAVLSFSTIETALNAGTNVTISTGTAGSSLTELGDINILSSITTTSLTNVSLTLNAHNDIIFNATSAGTDINISATGSGALNLVLNPGITDGTGQAMFEVQGSVAGVNVNIDTNGGNLVVNGDTSITGSGFVNLINTNWDVQQGHLVNLQFANLNLDAASVLTNGGDINMDNASINGSGQFYNKGNINLNGFSTSLSTIDTSTLNFSNTGWIDLQDNNTLTLTGGQLDLGVGSGLSSSGFSTLNSSVTVNGGALAGGDGSTFPGTLNINGDLLFNSGALYSVIHASDGMVASYVNASTVTINGGDLILNWQDSAAVVGAANFPNPVSIVGCNSGGCLDTSASANLFGFDTIVDPISTTTKGSITNVISTQEYVSYTIGTIDANNIYQWTGLSSTSPTNWSDPQNWVKLDFSTLSLLPVTVAPDSNTDVFIDGITNPTVDITSAATVRGMQAEGRINVGVAGSLDISGNAFILEPNNGIGGIAISAPDANVSRSGAGVLYILGSTLKLDQGILAADTVNWGKIQTSVGAPFQLDGNLVNNALFAIDANSGTNAFTGTGSIDNKGIISWANGAQLNLSGGLSLSSNSPYAQFQGAGLLSLNNTSSFNINVAPLFYDSTINWELIAGSVSGVDNLSSLPDQINWYSGSISSSAPNTVVLASGQVLNLYGTSDMLLTGGMVLDNSGTINFLSSGGDLVSDSTLQNFGQLIFNHSSNAADLLNSGGATLDNFGSMQLLSANDLNVAWDILSDSATFVVDTGTLILDGSMTLSLGNLEFNNSGDLTIGSAGALTMGSNSDFAGDGTGTLTVAGGILDLGLNQTKTLSNFAALNISSSGLVDNIQNSILPNAVNTAGTLIGNGNLTIPAATTMTANDSLFSGVDSANLLLIDNQGTINIVSGQSLTLNFAELNNGATGSITGLGSVVIPNLSTLSANNGVDVARLNLSGGRLVADNFTYAGDIDWSFGAVEDAGAGGLTTSGQVNLVSGVLNTDWTIDTTGVVDWLSPSDVTLQINNGIITNKGKFTISSYVDLQSQALSGKNIVSSTAQFINEGLLIIDADAFPGVQDPDVIVFDLIFDNVGGTIGIQSGTFRVESGGVAQDLVLDAAGESLQGYGTFDGNVVNTAGTVSPGKSDLVNSVFNTGTLSITGDYTQGVNGALVIKLDSTVSGLLHDRLNVAGTLNAGGDIRFAVINGKTPVQLALLLDQSFIPLSYGTFANRFDTVDIPQGLNFTFSNTGVISISSDSQVLNDIANQLEVLFDNTELNHPQLVRAMRRIDEGVKVAIGDEEDDEKKRAPRLVCR